ncbi:hypothetical protein OG21DRAFT_1095881 [Imleria badia]|nr:hypothetical protein OG21DRAFT_1095881 [Imleria badia]
MQERPHREEGELHEALTGGVRFTASYAFHVFKGSIKKMQEPLSWFLFLWMFVWMVSRMMPTIQTVFSPLCIIPRRSKNTSCLPIEPAHRHTGLHLSATDQGISRRLVIIHRCSEGRNSISGPLQSAMDLLQTQPKGKSVLTENTS